MAPLSMSVRGSAAIPRKAERAVLTIEITCTGEQRKTVSQEVAQSSRNLQTLLKSLSPPASSSTTSSSSTPPGSSSSTTQTSTPPLSKWTMSSLDATSTQPRDQNNNIIHSAPRTYTTSIPFTLEVRDFSFLGGLATQLSTTIPHVKIQGIKWILTDKTRKSFESELRGLAARDARGRARDYARALGYSEDKVHCVELREEGVNLRGGGGLMFSAMRSAGGGGGRGSRSFGTSFLAESVDDEGGEEDEQISFEDLEFVAEEIEMSAGVDCTFVVD